MDLQDLLRREEEAWKAFSADFARVPIDRRDEEGVVPGWSTKDLVWHCAYWARFCAEALESVTGDDWKDPFAGHDDAYWDQVNAGIARDSKTMSWEQIQSQAEPIRERVRAALTTAPDGEQIAEWFADETFTHYDEHGAEIRRFADA